MQDLRQSPSSQRSKNQAPWPLQTWLNLRTSAKLLAGFSLVISALIITGMLGLYKLGKNQDRLEFLVEDSLYAAGLAGDMDARIQKIRYLSRKLSTFDDKSQVPAIDRDLAHILGRFNEALAAYKKTDLSGREDEIAEIDAALPLVEAAIQEIRNTVSRGEYQAAETMIDAKLTGPADRLDKAVTALEQAEAKAGKDLEDQARADYASSRQQIIALIIIASVLCVFISLFIARSIVLPLTKAVSTLKEVSEGRLDVRLDLDSRDELGQLAQALNHALERMSEAMGDVGENAVAVASASERLHVTAHELSQGACSSATQLAEVAAASEDVSHSVQSVAAAVEEMDASIREIAQGASGATHIAGQAVEMSVAAREAISKLGQSSAEIGNVVRVISEIAEQTNLLALNATIESARAGEAGKGFAVVASEVKDLARETSKATEQIRDRVSTIQSDTAQAVQAIEEIGDVVQQINDSQAQIASAVEEQTATTQEMARSVAQGAAGTSQIALDVSKLAANAQESKAGANASSGAAQELSQMAVAVQESIGRFRY